MHTLSRTLPMTESDFLNAIFRTVVQFQLTSHVAQLNFLSKWLWHIQTR